jgi:hypothetical protein
MAPEMVYRVRHLKLFNFPRPGDNPQVHGYITMRRINGIRSRRFPAPTGVPLLFDKTKNSFFYLYTVRSVTKRLFMSYQGG